MHLCKCQWAFKFHDIQMTAIVQVSYSKTCTLSSSSHLCHKYSLAHFYNSTTILFVSTSGFLQWAAIQGALLDSKVTGFSFFM